MTANLIRVGDRIINLDNVALIELDYTDDEGASFVVFEFLLTDTNELEDGESRDHPKVEMFDGEEAEAIRRYFKKAVPDLLGKE